MCSFLLTVERMFESVAEDTLRWTHWCPFQNSGGTHGNVVCSGGCEGASTQPILCSRINIAMVVGGTRCLVVTFSARDPLVHHLLP